MVIWVLHAEPGTGTVFDPGSGHVRLMDGLAPADGEPLLTKTAHNAFTTTNLQRLLTERGVGELIVSGIRTEQCCETTARIGSDLGYRVTFVTDATATTPLPHWEAPSDLSVAEVLADPRTPRVEDIVKRTEYVLAGRFSTIASTAELTGSAAEWPALAVDDLVLVPGWRTSRVGAGGRLSSASLRRLAEHHAGGGTVASVCSGADALGMAGLLDGRRFTTHHELQDETARRYPAASAVKDVLFVQDGRIVTSAGIASGIDLALHLIAERHGPGVAARVARATVVYARRNGEAPQASAMLRHRAALPTGPAPGAGRAPDRAGRDRRDGRARGFRGRPDASPAAGPGRRGPGHRSAALSHGSGQRRR
jgi:putative intracellular protease/amidase